MKYILLHHFTICLLLLSTINTSFANNQSQLEAEILSTSVVIDTTSELFYTLCQGEEITINGSIYNENNPTGVEVLVNAAANGCDSIIIIELNFLPTTFTEINILECTDVTYNINGNTYDVNNPIGTEFFIGSSGCDSIVSIQMSFIDAEFTISDDLLSANVSDASSYQWLLDGELIEGANDSTYTATESGNYALNVEVNGIMCLSEEVFVTITSVKNILEDYMIKVYPNPIQEYIYIESNSPLIERINRYELINSIGQLIQQGTFQNAIKLEYTFSGILFIRLIDEDNNIIVKKLNS